MLTIRANTQKENILPYCRALKIPYNKGLYLYEAKDKDQVLGAALFEISGTKAEALCYTTHPEESHFIMDGVLRAGFNYAAEQHVPVGGIAETVRKEYAHFFEQLNYPNESQFNIQNFFAKYKNCAPGGTA